MNAQLITFIALITVILGVAILATAHIVRKENAELKVFRERCEARHGYLASTTKSMNTREGGIACFAGPQPEVLEVF